MASIKEIAELAGVSRGTVDRVLNHRGSVNPEKEKKVLEIAELLNYQPNRAGVALAAQKKKFIIGILLFGESNPFFGQVLEGLHNKAEELSMYSFETIEKHISFDEASQLEAIDEMLTQDINGLILSPYNSSSVQDKIDKLWDQGIPCVTINSDMPGSKRIAYVGSDYHKGGQIAAGLLRLISTGEIHVGIVSGSRNVLCHEERVAGFCSYLSEHAPRIKIDTTVLNDDDDYKSYEVVTEMLKSNPTLDAIYFTAAGVYGGCRAIKNHNGPAPKVITFDLLDSTKELLAENIINATIGQDPIKQGELSFALLAEFLLTGTMPAVELNYMEPTIIIRESL